MTGSDSGRLTRDPENGMIAGVAEGLADYFAVDPVLFRIAFVVLTLASGFGLLAYVVCWIVIPRRGVETGERPAATAERAKEAVRGRGHIVTGAVLIAVGLVFLAGRLPWLSWPVIELIETYWPVIVIAGGIGFLVGGLRGPRNG